MNILPLSPYKTKLHQTMVLLLRRDFLVNTVPQLNTKETAQNTVEQSQCEKRERGVL